MILAVFYYHDANLACYVLFQVAMSTVHLNGCYFVNFFQFCYYIFSDKSVLTLKFLDGVKFYLVDIDMTCFI